MGLNIISPPGTGGGGGGPPSGSAGGVLAGTYPNPGFAVNMATQAELDAAIVGLLDFKGSTDASANPNYPSALKGDCYVISVAGKIGGASGKVVSVGDLVLALADNAGGTDASVGTSWDVLESNIPGITAAGLAMIQAATLAAQQALLKVHTQGSNVASASTIDLEAATGDLIDVTGTTAITAVTLSQGHNRVVRFTGILTLTHGSSLVLPGGADITTAVGDYAIFLGYASSVVRVIYFRADGTAVVSSGGSSISTPRVYYVETTGNDGTGAVGNPALPYATAGAAYSAGVTAAVNFAIQLGVGSHTITLAADMSSYCKQLTGCGRDLTALTINGTPAPASDGVSGYATTFNVDHLNLTLTLPGGEATGLVGEHGGTAALQIITGVDCYLTASVLGGNAADGDGGNGGVIRCTGSFKVLSLDVSGGAPGGSGSPGSNGSLEMDGCDLYGCTYIVAPTISSFARCSYGSADITLTNNIGGNAAY